MNPIENKSPSLTSNRQSVHAMSKGWKIYRVVVAATVTNYLIMVLWSLPRVSEMAGGGLPFDMRPGGYSFDDARVFLSAITNAGRDFYLNTQHLLDLFYPTLFAITVAIPLARLVPGYWGWALAALAIAAGVFDHRENSAVAVMLRAAPDALTEAMVSTASNWSLAKSISTTIASVALLVVPLHKGHCVVENSQSSSRIALIQDCLIQASI